MLAYDLIDRIAELEDGTDIARDLRSLIKGFVRSWRAWHDTHGISEAISRVSGR